MLSRETHTTGRTVCGGGEVLRQQPGGWAAGLQRPVPGGARRRGGSVAQQRKGHWSAPAATRCHGGRLRERATPRETLCGCAHCSAMLSQLHPPAVAPEAQGGNSRGKGCPAVAPRLRRRCRDRHAVHVHVTLDKAEEQSQVRQRLWLRLLAGSETRYRSHPHPAVCLTRPPAHTPSRRRWSVSPACAWCQRRARR